MQRTSVRIPRPCCGGIQLDTVFGYLADAGFNALCHTALQYHIGTLQNQDRHVIQGIRATLVRNTDWLRYPGSQFTPVAGWYLSAAGDYKIEDFNPHPVACDPEHTCPGCSQ